MLEVVLCLGKKVRLKPTPSTAPFVIQTNEQPEVEVWIRLAETRQSPDRLAGVHRLTPHRGYSVDRDALNRSRIRGHRDIRFTHRVSEQLLDCPAVPWVLSSELAY